jgi:hypothetical protein
MYSFCLLVEGTTTDNNYKRHSRCCSSCQDWRNCNHEVYQNKDTHGLADKKVFLQGRQAYWMMVPLLCQLCDCIEKLQSCNKGWSVNWERNLWKRLPSSTFPDRQFTGGRKVGRCGGSYMQQLPYCRQSWNEKSELHICIKTVVEIQTVLLIWTLTSYMLLLFPTNYRYQPTREISQLSHSNFNPLMQANLQEAQTEMSTTTWHWYLSTRMIICN